MEDPKFDELLIRRIMDAPVVSYNAKIAYLASCWEYVQGWFWDYYRPTKTSFEWSLKNSIEDNLAKLAKMGVIIK